MSDEDMGNVLHDRASSSARSLPVCPTWAFIQEIVKLGLQGLCSLLVVKKQWCCVRQEALLENL